MTTEYIYALLSKHRRNAIHLLFFLKQILFDYIAKIAESNREIDIKCVEKVL